MRECGADVGLGFDGDGDRCGVVDNHGRGDFRRQDRRHARARSFKTASEFNLRRRCEIDGAFCDRSRSSSALGAKADYWKTGHSYIKRRVTDLKALAGFEKSGHFFFNTPVGRGYDDGLVTAIHVIDMLDRNPDEVDGGALCGALPKTWGSPTMSPHCADEVKYGIVDEIVEAFQADMQAKGETDHRPADPRSSSRSTASASRREDGTWGLVRASSNKPELVVVVESPASEARICATMFKAVDGVLRESPEVGAYNQTI